MADTIIRHVYVPTEGDHGPCGTCGQSAGGNPDHGCGAVIDRDGGRTVRCAEFLGHQGDEHVNGSFRWAVDGGRCPACGSERVATGKDVHALDLRDIFDCYRSTCATCEHTWTWKRFIPSSDR